MTYGVTKREEIIVKIQKRIKAIDLMEKYFRQAPICKEANQIERGNLNAVLSDLVRGKDYSKSRPGFISTASATVICNH